MRALGVIPARAGSKRVPNKNTRLLNGRPLLAYTIEAAAKSNLDCWVVSTESQAIADLALSYGAYVVKRPEELATDEATSASVCRHALNWMGASDYDCVVLLHPSSPIRDSRHIDLAVAALANSNAPALASVSCHKRAYVHNASIYVMRSEWLLKTGQHYCEESIPYLMDKLHSLDINDEIDFRTAEMHLGLLSA